MTGQEEALLAMIISNGIKKLPTRDLIEEIKRRSPCKACSVRRSDNKNCFACDWLYINSTGIKPDKFKPTATQSDTTGRTKWPKIIPE